MTHQSRMIDICREVDRVAALPMLQKAKAVDGVVKVLAESLLDMAMDLDKLNSMAEVIINGK